jgi:hypothetical protein
VPAAGTELGGVTLAAGEVLQEPVSVDQVRSFLPKLGRGGAAVDAGRGRRIQALEVGRWEREVSLDVERTKGALGAALGQRWWNNKG